ncbi:MAG: SDR family oxidoreductase [Vicinamibacterales bacterium]
MARHRLKVLNGGPPSSCAGRNASLQTRRRSGVIARIGRGTGPEDGTARAPAFCQIAPDGRGPRATLPTCERSGDGHEPAARRRGRRDAGPQTLADRVGPDGGVGHRAAGDAGARGARPGAPDRVVAGVDVHRPDTLEAALDRVRPDAVVNCVGVVKQLAAAKDPVESIAINALHPHVLGRLCAARGIRFLHVSTDCVFDGARGGYTEFDPPNASDLYGRSKALGEVTGAGSLTIRTSIIGRELAGASGLVEWFLSRRGSTADGYAGAVFSGFTTIALSEIVLTILADHPGLEGLYHVSADPLDKLTLLGLLNDAFGAGVTIARKDEPRIDRSLDSTRFRQATGFTPPAWPDMIAALAADPTPYDRVRGRQGVRR